LSGTVVKPIMKLSLVTAESVCMLLLSQGKEFETRLKEKKPGNLSDDLRTALGMPIGAVSIMC